MFSGIVEAQGLVVEAIRTPSGLQVAVEVPSHWEDLKPGDSVAHNGVCLTLEKLDGKRAWYTLGLETLAVTGWNESIVGVTLNMERSLRLGDRVHGHLVLGHVDGKGRVVSIEDTGTFRTLSIQLPPDYAPYLWKKGSVTLNGVSLTVNAANSSVVQVGLIPETLNRTNLSALSVGNEVLFEVDNMARGLVHYEQLKQRPIEGHKEVVL